jgi:hypothetical protein
MKSYCNVNGPNCNAPQGGGTLTRLKCSICKIPVCFGCKKVYGHSNYCQWCRDEVALNGFTVKA